MNTFVAATTPPQVVGMESHSSSSSSDNNDDKRKEEEEGEETPVAAGSHVTTPPGIQPSLAVKCKRDRLWRRNFISSSNKNKNKNKKANKDPSNWEQQEGDEDLLGDVDGCCCLPKRIFWKGSLDSQGCPPASTEEIKEIFYHSFMVLGAYAKNLEELTKLIREHHPTFDPHGVVEFQHPQEHGACPPYFIYLSHERKELAMYIRGLQLLHRQDYVTLMNNQKDEQPFDGGYVHHGMYQPAEWSAKHIAPRLKELLLANKGYRFTNVGHSLGAGVAPLFTVLLVKNPELIGGISPELIHSYGFAPPRVMSLDLSIKYAPYITSCVYQDDFFPRVSTKSMKRLFICTFALTGVVVFILWVKQAFQITHSDDPRRLYPPGKICHFVYKKPGRPGHHPIRARIVPSSQGRFERLVLSSSGTTKNHFVLSLCEHLKTYNWPEDLKEPWLVDVLSTRKEKGHCC
ncbi:unnamed protein product [Sphagnum troendelagicum]|uniref:Fungal lipase-type domain-containing protein n=1 Tax=Sphagnum troendelagicum TaxID=128251 RepID=A0ABP0U7W2_9BRYO